MEARCTHRVGCIGCLRPIRVSGGATQNCCVDFAACLMCMTLFNARSLVASPSKTPPLRIDLPLIPLGHLPSACTTDAVAIGRRMDPYYSDVWGAGSKVSWMSIRTARAQASEGVGRLPKSLDISSAEAKTRLHDLSRLSKKLDVLGVLDSWRTVTGEQLAAFTGQAGLASGKSETLAGLFASELIDFGVFSNGLIRTTGSSKATIYRTNTTGVFARDVDPMLTYAEWVAVTGGVQDRVGGGQQSDRHNVIATELALRIAEVCDVGAVVGEKLSLVDLLAYTGLGLPSKGPGHTSSADFTVLRHDGLRIAFEVTATIGHGLQHKIQNWADLLSERRMNNSALAVMFVLADKRAGKSEANAVRNTLYRMVRDACRITPGVSFDRVASKIGVADLREWFPEPGYVSPSFFTLDCDRPVGPFNELWERASFLDETSVPFKPRSRWAEDALDNMALLRGVPHWLRAGRKPPELWKVLLAGSGRTEIPIVQAVASPAGRPTRPFGEAFGVAGPVLPPKRMRSIR